MRSLFAALLFASCLGAWSCPRVGQQKQQQAIDPLQIVRIFEQQQASPDAVNWVLMQKDRDANGNEKEVDALPSYVSQHLNKTNWDVDRKIRFINGRVTAAEKMTFSIQDADVYIFMAKFRLACLDNSEVAALAKNKDDYAQYENVRNALLENAPKEPWIFKFMPFILLGILMFVFLAGGAVVYLVMRVSKKHHEQQPR